MEKWYLVNQEVYNRLTHGSFQGKDGLVDLNDRDAAPISDLRENVLGATQGQGTTYISMRNLSEPLDRLKKRLLIEEFEQ